MAILRMCPNAVHFREFQNDPITGHRYHGTCGETALATAMVCSTIQVESAAQAIDQMMAMTREMMAKGWADSPDGNTTTKHLYDEAIARGFTVAAPYDQWEDPIPSASELHPWLLKWAGVKPIVLMVTHAGEGLIAVDGSHAEAGVQGHFICVVGLADEGYVCNDGDNNEIANQLVIYSFAAIEKAHVTGFLMLDLQEGATPTMAVPSNWKDANGVITAPNNVPVIEGFADYIRHNLWDADDVPFAPEGPVDSIEPYGNPDIGAGNRQVFRKSMMGYTKAKGVYRVWLGQEYLAADARVKDLEGKLAAAPQDQSAQVEGLTQEVMARDAKLAQMEQDLEAARAAANPAPSAQDKADLDAMASIRAALRAHA